MRGNNKRRTKQSSAHRQNHWRTTMTREYFSYTSISGAMLFDITAAKLIVKDREPAYKINVAALYDLFLKAGRIEVSRKHALSSKIDVTVPVIIADLGLSNYVVIDGWHRVYRAKVDGITHLPYHLLGPDEVTQLLYKLPSVFGFWDTRLNIARALKSALSRLVVLLPNI